MLKSILTEPLFEPVSLADAKSHLVVEHNEDDILILNLIKAARRHVEARCNIALVRQQWRIYQDYGFSDFVLLPEPVQEVAQIQYVDGDGATQTLSTSVYTVDIPRKRVYLAYNQTWPATRYVKNAVWCDVWAGYYKTDESPVQIVEHVPHDIKSAMLLMVGDMYNNREKSTEMQLFGNDTYDSLLQPHIVYANG